MRNKILIIASVWLISIISIGTSATEIFPVKNNWYLFDVDELSSQSSGAEWIDAQVDASLGYVGDGSALTFSFLLTNAALLEVVDAGLSGDVFTLLINGHQYFGSSVSANSAVYVGSDFDLAWDVPEFSRLSIFLAPGFYSVTGLLQQSAVDEFGAPYLATLGGVRIVDVDESGSLILLCLGGVVLMLRRFYLSRANKGSLI